MRASSIVVGTGLLAIAASLGYCHVRVVQLDTAFRNVVIGEGERDVVAKMGQPHLVHAGCD